MANVRFLAQPLAARQKVKALRPREIARIWHRAKETGLVVCLDVHGTLTHRTQPDDLAAVQDFRDAIANPARAVGVPVVLISGGPSRELEAVGREFCLHDNAALYELGHLYVPRLLEDVALRTGLQAPGQQTPLAERGKEENRARRELLGQLLRRLEAIHPWHADVHNDDVGASAFSDRDTGRPVGGFSNDAHVRRTREGEAEAFPDDLVVVDDQTSDFSCQGGSWPCCRQTTRSLEGTRHDSTNALDRTAGVLDTVPRSPKE